MWFVCNILCGVVCFCLFVMYCLRVCEVACVFRVVADACALLVICV